ncbi:hypothetical protein GC177_07850 [bacterium]|nr:hypothetical protein [bacterium]
MRRNSKNANATEAPPLLVRHVSFAHAGAVCYAPADVKHVANKETILDLAVKVAQPDKPSEITISEIWPDSERTEVAVASELSQATLTAREKHLAADFSITFMLMHETENGEEHYCYATARVPMWLKIREYIKNNTCFDLAKYAHVLFSGPGNPEMLRPLVIAFYGFSERGLNINILRQDA